MTLKEQMELLGRAYWCSGGEQPLTFEVDVNDVREAFGRIDVHIRPVNGAGARWVSMDTVRWPGKAVAGA